MAVFVELDDDEIEPPHDISRGWPGNGDVQSKIPSRVAIGTKPVASQPVHNARDHRDDNVPGTPQREYPNRNAMTEALGCYPIAMSVAASIDLNTLDNLSRTCRQVRAGLVQYRKMLVVSTLRCVNDDLPVDPEETLRYRARAGNWYYMEDATRANYNGKSGECARDLVSGCRRCGTVVCRNCAIKPPAPIVLRDRHRRLCKACTKAPLGDLVRPRLPPTMLLESEPMQRLICNCQSDGVWLCQPCGRTIRGDDQDYKSIWKWRNQYGEVLGGLGTGIGDGDRGVICGRASECCASRDQEQETDCDAEDAREAEGILLGTTPTLSSSPQPSMPHPWTHPSPTNSFSSLGGLNASLNGHGHGHGHGHSPSSTTPGAAVDAHHRTPSPSLGPGYVRHEIEGIGGVVKTKRLKMVKVGACVPEWEDEKATGEIMGREIKGQTRSWCGWCWRVVPGKKDLDVGKPAADPARGKTSRSGSDSSSS